MLSRRQFFSGLLGKESQPGKSAPPSGAVDRNKRRLERFQSLESHVVADLVPYDVRLDPEHDRELRRRVRRALSSQCDDDLFSMNAVNLVERLTSEFLVEIGGSDRPAPY